MRVLLINPSDSGYYYRLGAFYPPLGLAYLGAVLRREGHSVRIVDMNVDDFDYKAGAFSDYDVVGISSDTVRIRLACDIALEAKKEGKKVIMGGPHPTFDFERLLKKGIADYVILGEGEESLPKLLRSISEGNPYPEIDGIAYRKGEKIEVRPPKFIRNLDDLPFPDRDLLPLEKYEVKFDGKRAMSIVTSRGCPFNCEFCSASQFMGLIWRKRSVENVLEEIEILYRKYGYRALIFFDDNFTLDPRRVIEISEGIMKRDMRISWWAFSRSDEVLGHEDMLQAMSKAGCKMLFIGFESASDDVLKEYNKKLRSEIAFEVVRTLKKFGIDVFASFILGATSETKDVAWKTVKFAKKIAKLGASIVQFSILTPYPGTRLFAKLRDKLFTRDPEKFDGTHLVFKHPNFSREEIEDLFKKAYFYVYTTPKLLLKRGLPFLFRLLKNKPRRRKFYNEECLHYGV